MPIFEKVVRQQCVSSWMEHGGKLCLQEFRSVLTGLHVQFAGHPASMMLVHEHIMSSSFGHLAQRRRGTSQSSWVFGFNRRPSD